MSLIGKLRNSFAIGLASTIIGCGSGSSGGGSGSYNQPSQPGYDQGALDDLLDALEEAGGSNNQNDNYTPATPVTPSEPEETPCDVGSNCTLENPFDCEVRCENFGDTRYWSNADIAECKGCIIDNGYTPPPSTPSVPELPAEDPYADYDGYHGSVYPNSEITENIALVGELENIQGNLDDKYQILYPKDKSKEMKIFFNFDDYLPPDALMIYYVKLIDPYVEIAKIWGSPYPENNDGNDYLQLQKHIEVIGNPDGKYIVYIEHYGASDLFKTKTVGFSILNGASISIDLAGISVIPEE